ncbi:MAG: sugar transferase, partial [Bdellovibrionales bacterium]|nr:sugar transferase [Bdellovibrionales bacterium]
MKRILDILVSFTALLVFSPVLIVFMVLIWLQDFKSPFYIAPRVAKGGGIFKMVKL